MASLNCPTCRQRIHSETIVDNEILCCPYCRQRILVPPFELEPVGVPIGVSQAESADEASPKKIGPSHQPDSKKKSVDASQKMRFINLHGNFIFRDSFPYAQNFQEGLAGVAVMGGIEMNWCPLEWGFINNRGEVLIDPQYSDVLPFSEGFAAVKVAENQWKFLDSLGDFIFPDAFSEAFSFRNGWALVKCLPAERKKGNVAGTLDYINPTGQKLSQVGNHRAFQEARIFCQGLAAVKIKENWGFVNRQGKLIVPCEFHRTMDFENGFAGVEVKPSPRGKGLWGLIDRHGKIRIPPQYDEIRGFTENLALVRTGEFWGFADLDGQMRIPAVYSDACLFQGGLAVVIYNDKHGLINLAGDYVFPPIFDKISTFSENRAIVAIEGKYGCIDSSGRVVIPFSFDFLGDFQQGMAAVKKKNWGFINTFGELVIPPKFKKVYRFTEGFARVVE